MDVIEAVILGWFNSKVLYQFPILSTLDSEPGLRAECEDSWQVRRAIR